jgi:hypothetical protein
VPLAVTAAGEHETVTEVMVGVAGAAGVEPPPHAVRKSRINPIAKAQQ